MSDGLPRRGGAPRYRFVMLDLDGTLVDSLDDLAAAGNAACSALGWPTHEPVEYRRLVGNGQRTLVARLAPAGAAEDELGRAYDAFCSYYAAHRFDRTRPYPGMARALDRMRSRGVSLGVLTNKNADAAAEVVSRLLGERFVAVQGRRDGTPPKPDPAMARALMGRMGADPAATLMVGDSDVDVLCGRRAGVDACGVLWGFRGRAELEAAGATHLAKTPSELADIVCG